MRRLGTNGSIATCWLNRPQQLGTVSGGGFGPPFLFARGNRLRAPQTVEGSISDPAISLASGCLFKQEDSTFCGTGKLFSKTFPAGFLRCGAGKTRRMFFMSEGKERAECHPTSIRGFKGQMNSNSIFFCVRKKELG